MATPDQRRRIPQPLLHTREEGPVAWRHRTTHPKCKKQLWTQDRLLNITPIRSPQKSPVNQLKKRPGPISRLYRGCGPLPKFSSTPKSHRYRQLYEENSRVDFQVIADAMYDEDQDTYESFESSENVSGAEYLVQSDNEIITL